MRSPHFLTQATSLAALALISSGLGFARDLLIARLFGATSATDAYLVALSIPTTVYAIFLGSGLNFAVIPRLAHILSDDPVRGQKLFSQVLTIMCVIGALVSIIILLVPVPFVRLFAPGITHSELSARFTRILSPLFFLLVASYSFASFQCARNHAPYWRLITLTQNVIVVTVVLIASRFLGFKSVIGGTVAGAFFAFLVQALLARHAKFTESWSLPTVRGEAMSILVALVPFALVFGIGGDAGTDYADLFLVRHFASRLDTGSITLLVLGNKLMGVPVLLVGSALGLALLPSVSLRLRAADLRGASQTLSEAFSYALLLICPVAIIYRDIGGELVSLLFGRGAISPSQIAQLGHILGAYAGATIGLTLVYVLSSFLGALRQSRTLIVTGASVVVLNAIMMKFLVPVYGTVGIAAVVSVGSLVYCSVLFALVARRLGFHMLAPMLRSGALLLVGAVGMHLVITHTKQLKILTEVPRMGTVLVPIVAALLAYGLWVAIHHRRIVLTG